MSAPGKVYHRSNHAGGKLKQIAYTLTDEKIKYHCRLLKYKKYHNIPKRPLLSQADIESSSVTTCKGQGLFQLCLNFIASNLDMVDSFVGLPSLIGEQIFDAAVGNNMFSIDRGDCETLQRRIELFLDAYASEVLVSLSLNEEWKFLACYLDQISIFLPYLTTIQLTRCNIGDHHEILTEIGKLHLLERLSLEKNDLGDCGIKNLLQQRRRARKGLDSLRFIYLAGNGKLTSTCLKQLQCLPSIKAVCISKNEHWKKETNIQFHEKCCLEHDHDTDFGFARVNNNAKTDICMGDGWGRKVLASWLHRFETAEKQRIVTKVAKENDPFSKHGSFYKKSSVKEMSMPMEMNSSLKFENACVIFCLCGRPVSQSNKRKGERLEQGLPVAKKLCPESVEFSHHDISNLIDMYK